MLKVNVREAKADLSRLIRLVESNKEDEIILARNGVSVARIVPMEPVSTANRIGVAEGKFEVPDDLDAGSEEIAAMFTGGRLF